MRDNCCCWGFLYWTAAANPDNVCRQNGKMPSYWCMLPEDWDIWHSPNHWADESTTLRYIDKILKAAVNTIKQELCLPEIQKCLLIWDVFCAHRTENVLQKLAEEGIECVFVPANCTSELQPMDLSVNKPLKDHK